MPPEQPASSTQKYIIGLVVIVAIIIGVSIYGSNKVIPNDGDDYEVTETTQTPTDKITATTSPATEKTFTMAEIQTHPDKNSCYTTIRGGVYDLTDWIYKHPGGAANILKLCGKDGTTLFVNQHGGQGRPEEELASFKIGTLAK